jgi:hypothetical protein
MSTQINDVPVAGPTWLLLRDYLAAHETLSEYDHAEAVFPDALAIALAGPKPDGNWSTNPIAWHQWEALYRAKLKYIRADAMLKAREVKL